MPSRHLGPQFKSFGPQSEDFGPQYKSFGPQSESFGPQSGGVPEHWPAHPDENRELAEADGPIDLDED
jgi:hypothetical protein